MRRAEQTIYRILEESEAPGRALYEARILPHGRQIDFPVWIEGVARYAIEAKGAGTSLILRLASGASSLTRGGTTKLRPPAQQEGLSPVPTWRIVDVDRQTPPGHFINQSPP